jgi:hypothetical protein
VPASPPAESAEQQPKIAELYSKCSQLADRQEEETAKIVGTILPVLAWLNEPVVLRPASLGGAFAEFRSVTLETGAMVVMTDPEGRVSSNQLAEFKTEECLAVLNGAFPELQRMVANKRRAAQVRPLLSLKATLGGSHLIVDMRSYRLSVWNAGGDCVGLRVSVRLPGGRARASKPCDVPRGREAVFDLGVYKEVSGAGRLDLELACRDVDGRELTCEESVGTQGEERVEATLKRKN